jgi:hypothetical protein
MQRMRIGGLSTPIFSRLVLSQNAILSMVLMQVDPHAIEMTKMGRFKKTAGLRLVKCPLCLCTSSQFSGRCHSRLFDMSCCLT